ncbi:MAG: NADH-quinone oxidoreductase subunit NuoH [Planctomycetota bacterium]|jgi:NADH-quinone oxidoreductase subunit H
MQEFLTSQLFVSMALAAVLFGVIQGAVAYCIYFERKISAWMQDRVGPNRVGPFGLFQPIADGLKFVFKEDVVPGHVEKKLFLLAPTAAFVVSFIGFAAIPWGGQLQLGDKLVEIQVANPDVGLLYILGVSSLAVYGIVLGGYASNNKYAFYGAIRATAQMLSYEIPMGLCILVVVLTLGEVRLEAITLGQAESWFLGIPQWNVFLHPLAALLLFVAILAECNRAPFDLAEAEQELVGGFHTEYSALKFGMFFLGEYAHMITGSALFAVLFLGGWHFPWLPWTQPEATGWLAVFAKMLVLGGKVAFLIFVMMWIRWTLPRFRFDQIMSRAWKWCIPITLGLVVWTIGLLYFGMHLSILAPIGDLVVLIVAAIIVAGSKVEITGRQANMPPISESAVST